ncbi:ATP-NAD kinase family protein [[Eubacterium] cellulosolvens]
MKKKLGLIVNPIAGMGGSVGLKGTDGNEILKKAIQLGAIPRSHIRTVEALKELSPIKSSIELYTYPHEMGEEEVRASSHTPKVLGSIIEDNTTSIDTKNAAKDMLNLKVDLILFVGGDGTARDIYEVVGDKIPVLGVPAGVKIHSSSFAINPKAAGSLAAKFLQGLIKLRDAEVMDIDEEAFRQNVLSAKLYGYLKVPHEEQMIQNAKIGSMPSQRETMESIAWEVINNMKEDYYYIIGPGTTTKSILKKLNLQYSLLGVDIIYQKKLIASDVNENQILKIIYGKKAKIVITVIGGQGYLFGRGNQQISSNVIKKVGKDNIIIVASEDKIISLRGNPLLVDTNDEEINKMLKGYFRITTGYQRSMIYKIA